MSVTEGTTAAPESASPRLPDLISQDQLARDPDGYLECIGYARSQHLGLRPSRFSAHADSNKELHPDQRPCPSWCWVGLHPDYGHTIEPTNPFVATHSIDGSIAMVASYYRGVRDRGGEVRSATLEAGLTRVGEGRPLIDLSLRTYDRNDEQHYVDGLLKLTRRDAQELVRVLSYLLDLIEADNTRQGVLA